MSDNHLLVPLVMVPVAFIAVFSAVFWMGERVTLWRAARAARGPTSFAIAKEVALQKWRSECHTSWMNLPAEVKEWVLSDPVFSGGWSDASGNAGKIVVTGVAAAQQEVADWANSLDWDGPQGQSSAGVYAKNEALDATFSITAINNGWNTAIGYGRVTAAGCSTVHIHLEDIIPLIKVQQKS